MWRNNAQSIYRPGQVWGYQTRPGDEQSYLIVVKVDAAPGPMNIVHVSIEGVKAKDPISGQLTVKTISHLPISEEALSASVTGMLGVMTEMPDFRPGYEMWRAEFENQGAGVFTIPVAVCVDLVARALAGSLPLSE